LWRERKCVRSGGGDLRGFERFDLSLFGFGSFKKKNLTRISTDDTDPEGYALELKQIDDSSLWVRVVALLE
jgi:hypothetical protein